METRVIKTEVREEEAREFYKRLREHETELLTECLQGEEAEKVLAGLHESFEEMTCLSVRAHHSSVESVMHLTSLPKTSLRVQERLGAWSE